MKGFILGLALLLALPALAFEYRNESSQPWVSVSYTVAGVASNHSGIQVEAPAATNGFWISSVTNGEADEMFCRIDSTTEVTTTLTTLTPQTGTGVALKSVSTAVRTTNSQTGTQAKMLVPASSTLSFSPPFYVGPGRFFSCWEDTIAQSTSGNIVFQEQR